MEPELIEVVERYRLSSMSSASQSEAIRYILKDWLISHGYLKE